MVDPEQATVNITTDPAVGERISRIRRAVYVFGSTLICLIAPTIFILTGHTDAASQALMHDMLTLAGSLALYYVGAGMVDRSKILDRVGDAMFSGGDRHDDVHKDK